MLDCLDGRIRSFTKVVASTGIKLPAGRKGSAPEMKSAPRV